MGLPRERGSAVWEHSEGIRRGAFGLVHIPGLPLGEGKGQRDVAEREAEQGWSSPPCIRNNTAFCALKAAKSPSYVF